MIAVTGMQWLLLLELVLCGLGVICVAIFVWLDTHE